MCGAGEQTVLQTRGAKAFWIWSRKNKGSNIQKTVRSTWLEHAPWTAAREKSEK